MKADGSGVAAALEKAGLGPGGTFAVAASPSPLFLQAVAAAWRRGWSLAPLRLRLPPPALAAQFQASGAALVLCDPAHEAVARRLAGARPVVVAPPGGLPPVDHLPGAGGSGGFAVLHTSGTGGTPRQVRVPWAMLADHARRVAPRIRDGPESKWLCVMPLDHVGGLALLVRSLVHGSAVVLQPSFDAAAVGRALHEGVTHVSLVPVMLQRVLEAWAGPPPAQLRCVLVGGDHADAGLVRAAVEAGWPIFCTYGMTETCSQAATATPEEALRFPGTSGEPIPGLSITLDAAGQIVVEGPTVVGGRVTTQDHGRIEGGRLRVLGRAADRIVTGGENVDPAEVESALRQAPGVRDACVVGVPDSTWGERVVALLVLDPEATAAAAAPLEAMEGWARAHLAPHQRPREWRKAGALPRTPSGKLARSVVRAAWPMGDPLA